MREMAWMGLSILMAGAAFGQAGEAVPAFELADVHGSPKSSNLNMRGGVIRSGRFEVRNATMLDLIVTAYGLENSRVLGGPNWLDVDRFDVIAKAPADTKQDAAKLMLRSLLAERFQLVVKNDTKPMPGFALTAAKGKPKLKESAGGGSPGCEGVPQQTAPDAPNYNVVQCRNMTMERFALEVRDMANAYLPNAVVDQTGLKGAYDFEVKWSSRGLLARQGADGISIFDAVDKQLGLKLEAKSMPMPVLRVEGANQKPTENEPGVITKLPPPPPAEFEVADIKPSKPDSQQRGQIQNGRVNLGGLSLKTMIQLAWDLNGDEMMADAPKWLDDGRWDVVAKAPIEVANQDAADEDALRVMLQHLLEDRFRLKTHQEERPINAYVLSAGKPKMPKADASNRTNCHDGPGADGKDPRTANPVLNRLITCQNMTMAQFVLELPRFANGYVHSAVMDQTGLDGAYDFTINFSGVGLLQGAGVGPNAEPNGAVSLPDAISKQMGVKLEMVKRPVQVLVIDHVEDKPTEN